jgi:hypothetical protein
VWESSQGTGKVNLEGRNMSKTKKKAKLFRQKFVVEIDLTTRSIKELSTDDVSDHLWWELENLRLNVDQLPADFPEIKIRSVKVSRSNSSVSLGVLLDQI